MGNSLRAGLCAVVLSVASAHVFSQEEQITAPEPGTYADENAIRVMEYYGEPVPGLTEEGLLAVVGVNEVPRDKLELGREYNTRRVFLFDRETNGVKDNQVDLIKVELYQPELRVKDVLGANLGRYVTHLTNLYGKKLLKQQQGENYTEKIENALLQQEYGKELLKQQLGENYAEAIGNALLQQGGGLIQLYIDEEFRGGYDGFFERLLTDFKNENNEPIPDGKWDREQPLAPRLEDLVPTDS